MKQRDWQERQRQPLRMQRMQHPGHGLKIRQMRQRQQLRQQEKQLRQQEKQHRQQKMQQISQKTSWIREIMLLQKLRKQPWLLNPLKMQHLKLRMK